LEQARLAAEAALSGGEVKKKKNAYQYFIQLEFSKAASDHPDLAPTELTRQVLAPKWKSLTTQERAEYDQLAKEDDSRWKEERKQVSVSTKEKQKYQQVKENEANTAAPLSAAGLFVAANWDSRRTTTSDSEAELLAQWIDLPPKQQIPWKNEAMSNQKRFAMSMVSKKTTKKPRKTLNAKKEKEL
jgi:hypothetical protein